MTSHHKPYWHNKKFLRSVAVSLLFILASAIINFFAGTYAAERASSPVTDIILSNTRPRDLDGLFVYGAVFLGIMILAICLRRPRFIPFTGKAIALFVVVRSVFITLTHIGPFPTQIVITSTILDKFTFGGDLFFSGHVGLTFLMALIFWHKKILRLFFILLSAVFAVVVLLAHLHYTIDVVAAYFITYTIYHLAETFFKKDLKIAKEGLAII